VIKLNDSDEKVLWHIIFDMYGRGEFLTAKGLTIEMEETADSDGSKQSILRILKKMDFRHKRWNDGRKFLMVQSNIVAAMSILHKM
jgi:hypothetical protein